MTAKTKSKMPTQLAECLRQSKRLTQELSVIKQDMEITARTPSQENLHMLRSRGHLLRQQTWAFDEAVNGLLKMITDAAEYYDDLDKRSLPAETR
jgi:hypothetical protein